jgi:hypothetical protein
MTVTMVEVVVAASIAAGVLFFWWLAGRGDDGLVDWPERAVTALLVGIPYGSVFSLLPLVILAALLGPVGG